MEVWNLFRFPEEKIFKKGFKVIAGVDEAGRGPLAGPLLAAAVIFKKKPEIQNLKDSKKLSSKMREKVLHFILNCAKCFGIGIVTVEELNMINNMHKSSLLAMKRAVLNLKIKPEFILIDGKFPLDIALPQEAITKGDEKSYSISAASIIAKVKRDKIMEELHLRFPYYNFAKNKGYATSEHLEVLRKFGPSPYHRVNFRPVKELYEDWKIK